MKVHISIIAGSLAKEYEMLLALEMYTLGKR